MAPKDLPAGYSRSVLSAHRAAVVVFIVALLSGLSGAAPLGAQTTPATTVAHVSADSGDLVNPDRPGIADGSRVIGPGQLQLEIGLQRERRRIGANGHSTTLFVPILIRAGLSDAFELRIESNSVTSTTLTTAGSADTRSTGYSPVSLGFKYALYDSHSANRRSLGMIVRVFPASGSSDFRSDRYTADARLAADWDFAPSLSLNPNVGIARYEDGDGRIFAAGLAALTLNYLPTERLNPFVDAGLQAPEASGGTSSVILDAGVAYIIGQDMQLDLSTGRGVHGTTPPRPFVAIGFSIRRR